MENMGKYVRNCWYVVGWSSHFGEEIVERRVMGEDIVLYRTSKGDVVALEDLCPHKFMPLSKGIRVEDGIQCGYHGLTFGCDGGCVRIPGQEHIPASIRVRTYPIQERHNVVWIWMGDPELEDRTKLFDLPQFTDPAWRAHQGEALHLEANFMNVADNLCDPAHVAFVHPTTLGNAACEDVPVDMSMEGDVIITSRWIRDAPPIGFFQNFGGFTSNVDRWHYYYLHTPNVAVIDFGSADVTMNLQHENRNEGVRVFALHFMTPVDENTTIDWWMHLRNTALDDEEAGEKMCEMFKIAFAEDKEVLEAVEKKEKIYGDRRKAKIAIDKGSNMFRKRVQQMIEAECEMD